MVASRARALVFLFTGILLQSAAGVLGKMAAKGLQSNGVTEVALNPWTIASLACLALQALVWPLALRGLTLSTAYAFTSLQILNVLLASRLLFNEPVGAHHLAGAVLIMAGITALGLGMREPSA
jgi:multidrug transporter EmrE-like cation transporter